MIVVVVVVVVLVLKTELVFFPLTMLPPPNVYFALKTEQNSWRLKVFFLRFSSKLLAQRCFPRRW